MSESDFQKLQRLNAEVAELNEKLKLEAEEKSKQVGSWYLSFLKQNPEKGEEFLKYLDQATEDKKSFKLAQRKEAKAIAEFIVYTVSQEPK